MYISQFDALKKQGAKNLCEKNQHGQNAQNFIK